MLLFLLFHVILIFSLRILSLRDTSILCSVDEDANLCLFLLDSFLILFVLDNFERIL